MLGAAAAAAAGLGAEDDRDLDPAAGHVAELRRLVDDRVEADGEEVHVHDLGDRSQARHRGADRGAEQARLGDRRVDHPLRPEAVVETAGRAVDTAAGADVDAHHDDVLVALHLGRQGPSRIPSM